MKRFCIFEIAQLNRSMKKLLLIAGFCCLSAMMYAQQGTDASNTVEVKKAAEETLILKEEVYDFGKIPQGKPVHHIFMVTNTGKTAMKLVNVQASCGCTTPEWDKENPIPAGEDGKITVGYNAASEGAFTKQITITYNETLTRQITIKGEVWRTPAASAPENKGLNDLKN